MTEGERIAEEMDGAPRAETARRIDAALAEAAVRARLPELERQAADNLVEAILGPTNTESDLRAALAEREAMVAALRQRLEQVIDAAQRVHAADFGMVLGAALHDGNEALTSTADAAARYEERITRDARCEVEREWERIMADGISAARQEGAEEMREKAAQVADREYNICVLAQWSETALAIPRAIAAAIRALT